MQVLAYDPVWPQRFAVEEEVLDQTIGEWVTGGIHHVGSTAVAGLAAKPVIDIMVGVTDLTSSRECFDRLAELNYQYAPYRVEQMHWFCKPGPARRTHHLHLVPTGSPRYRAELAFRDALRSRPELATEYAHLKQHLAVRAPQRSGGLHAGQAGLHRQKRSRSTRCWRRRCAEAAEIGAAGGNNLPTRG